MLLFAQEKEGEPDDSVVAEIPVALYSSVLCGSFRQLYILRRATTRPLCVSELGCLAE